MSVATLEQIGKDLSGWVAVVQRGESVAITQAGRVVAHLMPPGDDESTSNSGAAGAQWPDFAARRRAIFGDQVSAAGTAQTLVRKDRGE